MRDGAKEASGGKSPTTSGDDAMTGVDILQKACPSRVRVFRALMLLSSGVQLATFKDLLAQRQAVIIGIVADTAKRALSGAEVIAVRASRRTVTDSTGIFILILPSGEETLLVRRIGFLPETFQAELTAGDTLRIGVMLGAAPVVLPDLVVEVESVEYRGKMVGFANRMLTSGAPRSSFLTRADIDRLNAPRLIDHLPKTGLKLRRDRRGGEYVDCPRGRASMSGPPRVAYYVDGALMQGSFDLGSMTVSDIEAVEVYKSAAERPAQYNATGSDCTVLIWLRGNL
jgi:hypothetical protein